MKHKKTLEMNECNTGRKKTVDSKGYSALNGQVIAVFNTS